jgi:hypothetical protein
VWSYKVCIPSCNLKLKNTFQRITCELQLNIKMITSYSEHILQLYASDHVFVLHKILQS